MDKTKDIQQGNINLNIDTTPVLFCDFVIWNVSPDGIVLNFAQKVMGSNQMKIVARVGMGRELAGRFVDGFGKNLALTEVQGQTGRQVS